MKKIFYQHPCLNEQDMKQYLHEQLSEQAAYRLESHLIDCTTCREAMEDYVSTHQPDQSNEIDLVPSPSGASII